MSKTQIFSALKSALNQNAIPSFQPRFKNVMKPHGDDLIEEYKYFQTANKAEVIDVSPHEVRNVVASALEDEGAKKVLHACDLPFEGLSGDFETMPYDKNVSLMRGELFDADAAVLNAVCGVSSLGIVGVVSSPQSPRLLSLITPLCVILLKKQNVVRGIFEGIVALKAKADANGVLPTNMVFIAGPSRTADIELITVFGVHGPQKVKIIIY